MENTKIIEIIYVTERFHSRLERSGSSNLLNENVLTKNVIYTFIA